jgi:hypothetical protein
MLYPMQALMAVLKAHFGKCPAGHWVTFRALIGGVKLFAIAYGMPGAKGECLTSDLPVEGRTPTLRNIGQILKTTLEW